MDKETAIHLRAKLVELFTKHRYKTNRVETFVSPGDLKTLIDALDIADQCNYEYPAGKIEMLENRVKEAEETVQAMREVLGCDCD